jgi:hypothetical protein
MQSILAPHFGVQDPDRVRPGPFFRAGVGIVVAAAAIFAVQAAAVYLSFPRFWAVSQIMQV